MTFVTFRGRRCDMASQQAKHAAITSVIRFAIAADISFHFERVRGLLP